MLYVAPLCGKKFRLENAKITKNAKKKIAQAVFRNEQAKKVNGNMMTQYDLPKQNSKRTKRCHCFCFVFTF